MNPSPKAINLINFDGHIVKDELLMSNMFNSFFASVFTHDDGNLPVPPFVPEVNLPMQDVNFSTDKIVTKLCALNETSACGPDGIHPLILKRAATALSTPLSAIFNKSYTSSMVPSQWLTAHVTPIYKNSGSRLNTENYRPISLTSILCKIYESILKDEMLLHLQRKNLIRGNQHGFLPKKSTQSCLIEIFHDWSLAFNEKQNVDCIFIDFKKAFDSIAHQKLLYKLSLYGFAPLVLNWIKSFLSGRTQQVKLGPYHILSSIRSCSSGVPEGSVLGPLLFIIFINDLVDMCHYGSLKMYADDATLYARVNTLEDAKKLQADLDNIYHWSIAWQLHLNIKKCLFMRLRSACKLDHIYSINSIGLQQVTHTKLLGVIISQNMSQSLHCDYITSLGRKQVFLLLNAFRYSNLDTMTALYKTYVRPLLEYSTAAWSPHLLSDIDKIESVQRFFTRSLAGMSSLTYCERLSKLGLQSLEERRIFNDCLYIFKLLHGHVNIKFTGLFTFTSNIIFTNMALRRNNSLLLYILKFNIDAYEHCFALRAARYWNVLHDNIVLSNSVHSFCNHLLTFDFSVLLRGRAVTRL